MKLLSQPSLVGALALLTAVENGSAFAPCQAANDPRVATKRSMDRPYLFAPRLLFSPIQTTRGGATSLTATRMFLELDAIQAKQEIALNWGWILNAGIMNVVAGLVAMALPFWASEIAYAGTWVVMAVLGGMTLYTGIFSRSELGFRVKSALLGIFQLFIATRMYKFPFKTLNALTALILASTFVEGIHEVTFALQNRSLPRRWWNVLSGIGNVAVATLCWFKMPVSSLVVPGLALGINLFTLGVAKVAIGLYGQEEARSMIQRL